MIICPNFHYFPVSNSLPLKDIKFVYLLPCLNVEKLLKVFVGGGGGLPKTESLKIQPHAFHSYYKIVVGNPMFSHVILHPSKNEFLRTNLPKIITRVAYCHLRKFFSTFIHICPQFPQ